MSLAPTPPVSPRECLTAWLFAFVGLPLAMLVLAGPTLFTRPFWEDEVFSWLIASDPSSAHAMAALAGGVDTNAPLLHWLLRGVGSVLGHTPLAYRSAMAAGMATALVGLYVTLRLTVRVGPAVVGCLFFCSLPLVVIHTTEARFYGWLTAAAIWTAYGVARRRDSTGVLSATGVAIASIALCGFHYFGVVALAGIALADGLTDGLSLCRAAWTARATRLFPTAAGFATTACLAPLLRAQRATVASVGGTWIIDDFAYNLHAALIDLVPLGSFLALLAVAAIGVLHGFGRSRANLDGVLRSPLTAFWLYAATLLAFDRLVQPVLVARYFIIVLPAVAALVAHLAATFDRRTIRATGFAMAVMACVPWLSLRSRIASPSPTSADGLIATAMSNPGRPIVADWLAYALPLWARPELRDRVIYVPGPRLTDPSLRQAIAYDQRMGRMVSVFYGLPRVTARQTVDRLEDFLLLSPFPETIDDRFAARRIETRSPVAFRMRKRDPVRTATAD